MLYDFRKKYFARSMFMRWRDFTLRQRLVKEQELALQEVLTLIVRLRMTCSLFLGGGAGGTGELRQ